MITSIIISHTHAPLQLCIVTPLLWSPSVSLQIVICSDNTELKWCMGVANNYACYCQLYRLVPILFTPVHDQLCTFLSFLGKLLCLHITLSLHFSVFSFKHAVAEKIEYTYKLTNLLTNTQNTHTHTQTHMSPVHVQLEFHRTHTLCAQNALYMSEDCSAR